MVTEIVQYFQTDSNQYWNYMGQHMKISLLALIIACAMGLPIGYLGSRNHKLTLFCETFSQILRIIPSLTLLFILIPFVSVGTVPALIALVVLALPPLVINTILGFKEVPDSIKEVSIGLGMNKRQLFRKVEVPLALPYILNGIKLALVEIIASATLATYIGAGGLGTLIFTGLGLYRMDLLLIGGGSVAILSLLSMVIFDLVIKKVKKHHG